MKLTPISRYMALLLRHHPEQAGITLDEHGWAHVDELIKGIQKRYPQFQREILEEIVRTDSKQRYAFNEDHTLIRTNHGHSIPVDIEFKHAVPPDILYHGTAKKYVSSIQQQGLISKSRLYVHLSTDVETAIKVGKRHGEPVIYQIDAKQMYQDGIIFYLSANYIWLVKKVPLQYMKRLDIENINQT